MNRTRRNYESLKRHTKNSFRNAGKKERGEGGRRRVQRNFASFEDSDRCNRSSLKPSRTILSPFSVCIRTTHARTANRMIQNAISWHRDINSKLLVCREGGIFAVLFSLRRLVLSPRLGETRNNAGRHNNARISLRAELFVIRKPFRSTRTHSTLMDTDYISRTVDAASAPLSAFHPAKYVFESVKK